MQIHKKLKKRFEKDQQTIKTFDKFYRKFYKITYLIKMKMNLYVIFLLKFRKKQKLILFYKH